MGDLVAAFSSNNFIGKEAKKEACIGATSCSAIFSIACHWFGSEFHAKPFRGPGILMARLNHSKSSHGRIG